MEQANSTLEVISSEETTNVIKFPKTGWVDTAPTSLAEAKEKIEEARRYYSYEVTDEAFQNVMQIFQSYGFFTKQDKVNQKDLMAIHELFLGALLRYNNIEHPMQKVVDEAIVIYNDENMPDLEDLFPDDIGEDEEE